jgi:hypothetical protein
MAKPKKKINDTYVHQINVLKALSSTTVVSSEPKQYQISEITEQSGLADERETQRYLFILEGQKLVSPFPEGDFTSKTWQITRHGLKTLKSIYRSLN